MWQNVEPILEKFAAQFSMHLIIGQKLKKKCAGLGE